MIGPGDAQPVLGQAGDLLGRVGADLLQQRADEVLEDLLVAGDAGRLQGPADPLLHLVDQAGDDADDQVLLGAHVGHEAVHAVEHLEDRADPLLAVGLHRRGFRQSRVSV